MHGSFSIRFLPAAERDLKKLNPSVAKEVLKKIKHVAQNPRPTSVSGYGHSLAGNLSGFLKIKLLSRGLRVVYALREIEGEMVVVVVAARANDEVYKIAERRARQFKI